MINEIDYHRISSYRSHNLEVIGSSPIWSTTYKKHLQFFASAFCFVLIHDGFCGRCGRLVAARLGVSRVAVGMLCRMLAGFVFETDV